MDFTSEEKKILSAIGRSEYGKRLEEIFERLKNEMSSIDGIEGDYGAQVEGRKIFKDFCKKLINAMNFRENRQKKPEIDDFD